MTIAHIIRKKLDQLQREGFSLDELNDWYQIRVNERLDVYPRNRRFHDLHTGQRGGYENSFDDFIRWFFQKGPGGNVKEAHNPIEVRVHGGMPDLSLPPLDAFSGAPTGKTIPTKRVKVDGGLRPGEELSVDWGKEEASITVQVCTFHGVPVKLTFISNVSPLDREKIILSLMKKLDIPRREEPKWICSTCQEKHLGACPPSRPQGGPRYRHPRLSRLLSRFFGV